MNFKRLHEGETQPTNQENKAGLLMRAYRIKGKQEEL